MVEHEIIHIAVVSPKAMDASLVNKVAAVINKEPCDTRLLLVGGIPRIVTRRDSLQQAEATLRSLKELGLAAFLCQDSLLRKPPQRFVAHRAEFGQGEILFLDKGGHTKRVAADKAFLVLIGKSQTITEDESTNTKTKIGLNVPVLLLTGVPVIKTKTVKTGTTSQALKEEAFARIYSRESSDSPVHLLQNHMDFSCLGPSVSLSSPANFNAVVAKIREIFPQALFDDKLIRIFKTDIPSSGPEEDLEINCTLLYLYHLQASNPL